MQVTSIFDPNINKLKRKLGDLSRQDLLELAAQAIFHLRCVSGSRNSFNSETMEQFFEHGVRPERDKAVEAMHHAGVEFLKQYDR